MATAATYEIEYLSQPPEVEGVRPKPEWIDAGADPCATAKDAKEPLDELRGGHGGVPFRLVKVIGSKRTVVTSA